jgi:hypothetical protein
MEMKHSDGPSASPIAAMIVVAALLTVACTAGQGVASSTPASTTRASTTPAPSVAASSDGASTNPSPATAALIWTPASLEKDWPAPVRAEPAGGATVVPILWTDGETGRYEDPTGDTESDAFPWVDIHAVSFCHNHACPIVWVPGAPNVDPTEQWIAYGLVVDDNGDGVADRRFGTDNIPKTTSGEREHREWITDLHTGRTVSLVVRAGSDLGGRVGDTYLNTSFPAAPAGPAEPAEQPKESPCSGGSTPPSWMVGLGGAEFDFGRGDVAGPGPNGGGSIGAVPSLFYAWASVIVDGRVVATDYAPDAGWLHPSSKAPPIAGEVGPPDPGEVAPPIDSLEEAIAAVGQLDPRLPGFYELNGYVWRGTDSHGWSDTGFQPCDMYAHGASCWLEAEARGDGWDLTFVCGPGTLFAQTTFGGCPAGCREAHAKFHVSRDGTVNALCEWPEGEAVGSPVPGDHTAPGNGPPGTEEPAATPC